MSFDDVKESIEKLRDITEARALRKENQALKEKLEIMDWEHQLALEKTSFEIMNLKILIMQKDREIKDRDSVELKYNKKSFTPRQFDKLVDKRFDGKVKAEIENSVIERWKKEAPKLIYEALLEELNKYPNSCMPQTGELIDSIAHDQRDKQLKNRTHWPKWFQDLFESEVLSGINKGLDEEFSKNVENTAQTRLSYLIGIEWPRYIRKIADQFFKDNFREQLIKLQRPITISCDRCRHVYSFSLTHNGIADLFRKPTIRIPCTTPGCRDLFRPHGIHLSLAEVILQIINPPQYLKVRIRKPQSDGADKTVKSF